ncbi:TraR/DksA family transcriptional regulator [Candidatus Omnitrophota bacterium]
MTPEEQIELKIDIEQRIAEIESNITSLETTSKPVAPDQSLGRLTRMDAMQIQKMQEANLETSRSNLLKLQDGLKKIDEGSFGQCYYCKGMIGFERLKALPESNMCIKCAEKYSY